VHVLRTRKFYKSTSDVSVLEQGLRNGCIRVASVLWTAVSAGALGKESTHNTFICNQAQNWWSLFSLTTALVAIIISIQS